MSDANSNEVNDLWQKMRPGTVVQCPCCEERYEIIGNVEGAFVEARRVSDGPKGESLGIPLHYLKTLKIVGGPA